MIDRLIICRHAHSPANVQGQEAFGQAHAGLSADEGVVQAYNLGLALEEDWGVQLSTTPVAVSEMKRSHETAQRAQFQKIAEYALLNEVAHGCKTLEEWHKIKDERILQPHELDDATALLSSVFATDRPAPEDRTVPTEAIWISHGYRMAHLLAAAAEVGLEVQRKREDFIPRHCEIVSITRSFDR